MSFVSDTMLAEARREADHPHSRSATNIELPPSCGGDVSSFALPARATALRFLVLVFAPGFMFGNYYFFDQTSATQLPIEDHTGMSAVTFSVLTSVYSWPNVILPLFGGMLIDKIGTRAACIAFSTVVLMGSSLFSVGLWMKSTWILIVARTLFGMGAESQNVACLTVISRWFVGKELAFAMSICVAVSRLGSVATFHTQPGLVQSSGIVAASWVGTLICGASLGSAIMVAIIDKLGERKDRARGLLAESDTCADVTDGPVHLADMLSFRTLFWLTSGCCVSVYVAAFPFMQVTSVPFLEKNFGWDEQGAADVTALPNLVSAFASPVFGVVCDRVGGRPPLIVAGIMAFIVCYIGFIVTPSSYQPDIIRYLYMVLGVALSLFGSVIWPCVPLVVEESKVGTAIGMTTAMQNFGMAVAPILLAKLQATSGGFAVPFMFIIASCCLGLVCAVWLWILDARGEKNLMRP
eukprot:TRINITY_DN22078_c0_g2_i1.p1 TRINITY_DN22078_c0_g2~~TRINITY_DN22078_c0_g2_i1.p1  ORF type:complete len:466 (+),score=71.28 TRINITY_DN22078_c0_g2_i1:102-1499(+)